MRFLALIARTLGVGLLLVLFPISTSNAQTTTASELTVARIMQDPDTWIGGLPGSPYWTEDGNLLFSWNPQGAFASDSLFRVRAGSTTPELVSLAEQQTLAPRFSGWQHGRHVYTADYNKRVFTRNGDIHVYDRKAGTIQTLTRTNSREFQPRFTPEGDAVLYRQGDNLMQMDLAGGGLVQRTDIRSGSAPAEPKSDTHEAFLEAQQEQLFEFIRDEAEDDDAREAARDRLTELRDLPEPPPPEEPKGVLGRLRRKR